jgi:hypothetical protein
VAGADCVRQAGGQTAELSLFCPVEWPRPARESFAAERRGFYVISVGDSCRSEPEVGFLRGNYVLEIVEHMSALAEGADSLRAHSADLFVRDR